MLSMPSKDFRFGISGSVNGVDLNQLLVAHPLSTYFMRVAEDILELGLGSGDVLIVDRSLSPKKSDLIVAATIDDPDLKIMRYEGRLDEAIELWGVAVHVIRSLRP